jgi:hypothetical protein
LEKIEKMIRLGIEIDGVLRDTFNKFEQIYQKYFIDELELVDEDFQYEIKKPYNTPDYRNHFLFKTEEEYLSFVYEEFAMQIFGHAPSTSLSTFYDLKDLVYNMKDEVEIVLLSEQVGKTKPATLFFISKFSCEVDKIIFFNKKNMEKIWPEIDILLAASPTLLESNVEKTTIKFETTYNSSIEVTPTISNLKELESTIKKLQEK